MSARPGTDPLLPAAGFAFQRVHPAAPALRIRYREGVVVGPHGFPAWSRYARAQVELPAPPPGLGIDEYRVFGVVVANDLMARSGDPMWSGDARPAATPPGWTWAYQALTRRVCLVPVELHAAFRHVGGLSTLRVDRGRRGVRTGAGQVPIGYRATVADDALDALEQAVGVPLPAGYRRFLAETDGGRPTRPAVHPAHGFVADQPLFGLSRQDRMQRLDHAPAFLADRFTGDFLPIGYVQGGTLAVRVNGVDTGSVLYLDDDDHRDRAAYGPEEVCSRLLHRCADDVWAFLAALRPVPDELLRLAAAAVDGGHASRVTEPGQGEALPAAMSRPGPAAF